MAERDDLASELQKIYDSEINIEIGWLWDGGIEVRLGDRMNGFVAEETVVSTVEIVPWLQSAIARFYPESIYAEALPEQIRQDASQRLFRPPTAGAMAKCPHCGANYAEDGGTLRFHLPALREFG